MSIIDQLEKKLKILEKRISDLERDQRSDIDSFAYFSEYCEIPLITPIGKITVIAKIKQK